MMSLLADLHIHSALSPCAGDDMSPPAIVEMARDTGLHIIALCDHNAAGNVAATQAAAQRAGGDPPLLVIAGMEITTAEEVHILGLFPQAANAETAAAAVAATLPPADDAYYARFGTQSLMDVDGQPRGFNDRMLAVASTFDVSAAIALIHQHQGLAIAAHINRPSFSVLSQLGLFPTDVDFDAVEIFSPCDPTAPVGAAALLSPAVSRYGKLGRPLLASSDAHFLTDVGRCRTEITVAAPTFAEFVLALRGTDGRGVRCA